MSNALHAGWPARSWEECARQRLVVVEAAPRSLPQVVEIMSAAVPDWSGRIVLVVDAPQGRAALDPLARRGARTASVTTVTGSAVVLLLECHPAARASLRRLFGRVGASVLVLDEGGEAAWRESTGAIQSALLVLLEHTVKTLRRGGLDSGAAHRLTEHHFLQVVRAFKRGARLPKHQAAMWSVLTDLFRLQSLGFGGGKSRAAHTD